MIISSQSGGLMTSPEKTETYAPHFAAAGFGAVDYGFYPFYRSGDMRKQLHSELFDKPMEELEAYFKSIADILTKNGISVGQTHAPFPSGFFDEQLSGINDYIRETIIKSIRLTAVMKSKYIVVHPIIGGYGSLFGTEEEYRCNIGFYSSLINALKENDVICCLENMWDMCNGKIYGVCCSNEHDVCRYIDELNSIAGEERFAFCLDTGHATVCSDDPVRFINTLGPRLKTVHLHDVDINRDSHTCPYLGIADWDGIMKALSDSGYGGTLNFEAATAWSQYPVEVYPEAIRLLGAIGKYFAAKYF